MEQVEHALPNRKEVDKNMNFEIVICMDEQETITMFMEQVREWRVYHIFHYNGYKFDRPMLYVRGIITGAKLHPKKFNGEHEPNYKHRPPDSNSTVKEKVEAAKFMEYHMSFTYRMDSQGITQQKQPDLNKHKREATEKHLKKLNGVFQEEITAKTGDVQGGQVSASKLTEGMDEEIVKDFMRCVRNEKRNDGGNMANIFLNDMCDNIVEGNREMEDRKIPCYDADGFTDGSGEDDGGDDSDNEVYDTNDMNDLLSAKVLRNNAAFANPITNDEEISAHMNSHLIMARRIDYVRPMEYGEHDIMYVADEMVGRKNGIALNTTAKATANVTKLEHFCVHYDSIHSTWRTPERPLTEEDKAEALREEQRLKEHNDFKKEKRSKNDDGTIMNEGVKKAKITQFETEMKIKYNLTEEEINDGEEERQHARVNNPCTGILHHLFIIYAIIDVLLTVIIMWCKNFFEQFLTRAEILHLVPKDLFSNEVAKVVSTLKYIFSHWRSIVLLDPYKHSDMTEMFTPNLPYSWRMFLYSRANAAITIHGTEGIYRDRLMTVADFASMYLTVMIMMNLFLTSLLHPRFMRGMKSGKHFNTFILPKVIQRTKHENLLDEKNITYEPEIRYRKVFVTTREFFEAPGCAILMECRSMRKVEKKKTAQCILDDDKMGAVIHNCASLTYKLFGNATYGSQATVSTDLASTITFVGRLLTTFTSIVQKYMHNMHATISDTDSMMCVDMQTKYKGDPSLPPINGGIIDEDDDGMITRIWRRLSDEFKNGVKIPTIKDVFDAYDKKFMKILNWLNEGNRWVDVVLSAAKHIDHFEALKQLITPVDFNF